MEDKSRYNFLKQFAGQERFETSNLNAEQAGVWPDFRQEPGTVNSRRAGLEVPEAIQDWQSREDSGQFADRSCELVLKAAGVVVAWKQVIMPGLKKWLRFEQNYAIREKWLREEIAVFLLTEIRKCHISNYAYTVELIIIEK